LVLRITEVTKNNVHKQNYVFYTIVIMVLIKYIT